MMRNPPVVKDIIKLLKLSLIIKMALSINFEFAIK